MADINTLVERFENGGVITFDADTVRGIVPGSFSHKPAIKQRIVVMEGAAVYKVWEGDQELSELSFSVRGDSSTGGLLQKIRAAGTAGAPKLHTIVAKVPSYPGSATGNSWTWTNCWLKEMPTQKMAGSGQEVDEVSLTFNLGSAPAAAAYP